MENSYKEIPKYWNEIYMKYMDNVFAGNPPANPCEKAVVDHCVGEYGVCIDDLGKDQFRYLIAGRYTGGEIPEGMVLFEFPVGDWAVFDCFGPLPEALQSVNTKIYQEWLPGNPDYVIAGNSTVEWYDSTGDQNAPDYHSAIWIPVKRK